jgi:enoyl-CoA hydratase/carnithine racemase
MSPAWSRPNRRAAVFPAKDQKEGMAAFVEKRKPAIRDR